MAEKQVLSLKDMELDSGGEFLNTTPQSTTADSVCPNCGFSRLPPLVVNMNGETYLLCRQCEHLYKPRSSTPANVDN